MNGGPNRHSRAASGHDRLADSSIALPRLRTVRGCMRHTAPSAWGPKRDSSTHRPRASRNQQRPSGCIESFAYSWTGGASPAPTMEWEAGTDSASRNSARSASVRPSSVSSWRYFASSTQISQPTQHESSQRSAMQRKRCM